MNWGVYPNPVQSFSIPRNKILVNVDYTTLGNHFAIAFIQIYSIHQLEKLQKKKKKIKISGRRHSMWIISISENYEVNGVMSVKSFRCPNFLFNMTFIFWLRNMEVIKRITIREIIIVLICLQISLIDKSYSCRLSRKKIWESYIWKIEFPLRRS